YEPCGFFVPHRDTEKVDGMCATLVVCLPSRYEGGELVVRHQGDERTFDLRNADPTRLTWAAFYADCLHELRPISDGHRVCLVFNLVREEGALVPPDHRAAVGEIADALRGWATSDDGPTKLLV